MPTAEKEETVPADALTRNLGKPKKDDQVPIKEIVRLSRFQTRAGHGPAMVDEERANAFAEKMKNGEEFPEVKIMEVEDSPGHKGTPVKYLFDGFHTTEGAERAKRKTVAALVFKGTWAQLHAAAATANVEHDDGGKPRTNADKKKAVESLAQAYILASEDKKSWPSNRGLASELGWVSYQFVNDVDPFGRKKNGESHDDKKASKRAAAKPAANGQAAPVAPPQTPASALTWELRDTKTNKLLGKVEGTSRQKAMEAAKEKLPPDTKLDNVIITLPPIAVPKGAEVPNTKHFDFDGFDRNLGSTVRGLEAMGDIFGIKKTPEFAGAERSLNALVEQFVKWRKELTAKKPKEEKLENAKTAEAK